MQPDFFADPAHLAGSTGARVLAELLQHALDTTIQSLKDRPYTQEEEAMVMGTLPQPLYKGLYLQTVVQVRAPSLLSPLSFSGPVPLLQLRPSRLSYPYLQACKSATAYALSVQRLCVCLCTQTITRVSTTSALQTIVLSS